MKRKDQSSPEPEKPAVKNQEIVPLEMLPDGPSLDELLSFVFSGGLLFDADEDLEDDPKPKKQPPLKKKRADATDKPTD